MSAQQQLAPERSIFGIDPLDDFATLVGDWILYHGGNRQNLEIEGKVGLIIDSETGQRVQLPVRTETVVDLPRTRFESKMTMSQHASYNRLLNKLVSRSGDGSYTGAKVSYARRKEVDYFHPAPGGGGKVRVTRDADTLAIKPNGIVQKSRVADLNVYCPGRAFDYRISVNTETPAQEPTSESTSIREKNRLSYSHQNFVVDLTQVTMPEKPQEPIHELEIEFKDVPALLAAAQSRGGGAKGSADGASSSQDWTAYDDQILIFLNNLRLLIR
ncbi:related to CTL1 - RNA 5`-triphosphatase with manganese- or cobalt-dependent NTPase activities [Pseudozyma flocculosa]|nr:related to CTL1 - RNA 5`-triphosphatase with manganese- or cobalt-dependent NTPase activities [Pseudozyma flocculosa]